ncbi:MAG: hypothetical protein HY921_07465 [Elusimicrobia bacterium]|nr:hypothetical protein [Elusimicrobiota bacterium]
MKNKAKTRRCVECRYCELEADSLGRTRNVCTHRRKRALPANVTSRPACANFKRPPLGGHWGP